MNDFDQINLGFANYAQKLNGLTPRENALLAYQHKTPETIPNLLVDMGMFWACLEIERYPGYERGKDMFGVEWQYDASVSAPMPVGEPILKDIADWKDVVKFPDLESIDWEKQAYLDTHMDFNAFNSGEGVQMMPDGASCMDGEKAGVCLVFNGMFERLHALMGVEDALIALTIDPDSCFEFFSAVADYKIEFIKKIAEHYPVDIIDAHDDYGAGDRLFMSLPMWRKLIKPNLKRIVDATHDLDLIYQHHSCGYVEPLIPELIDIGVDAIEPLMANCNTNLKELKKEYGSQITFCGGFDNVRVFDRSDVTADEVKSEYRRAINDLAPGGSYVAYPSGLFTSTVPFLAEHFNYGVDFYKTKKS